MGSESPVIDREEVEHTLCQIAEVEAARVVTENGNAIQELHVLASGNRAPRQIVRDIESLLMARFSVSVDQKNISVAQINNVAEAAAQGPARLQVKDIATTVKEGRIEYVVTIARENGQKAGCAQGYATKTERLRLAALAALDAISKLHDDDLTFCLEHLSIVTTAMGGVALVCITEISKVGEEVSSGSAVVKEAEDDAVIKAVLAAIDRN